MPVSSRAKTKKNDLDGLLQEPKDSLSKNKQNPSIKKKGVKEGTKKALVEPDFDLECNLGYLQLKQQLSQFESHDTVSDSLDIKPLDFSDDSITNNLPGISAGYLRTIKKNELSLHSDLYKLAVIADSLGINLIGSPENRNTSLFVKIPKTKKNPEVEISGLKELIDLEESPNEESPKLEGSLNS